MLNRKKIACDFCIIGGGMAGICAAIAAARGGASVVLMHERPVLGGNASSEIRMWICGANGENNRETGIMEEIALENYYRNPTKNYFIWDSILYDFVVREKNITLLLNCTCMDAETQTGTFADGRTKKITRATGYQMTTQTFFDVYSTYYADCSGDSILAPLTGAEYRIGREAGSEFGEITNVKEHDCYTMGMSCLIQGRETDQKIPYIPPAFSAKLDDRHFRHHTPNLESTYENFWYLELGGERDTIADTQEIAKELLPLATGTWDYIKNSGKYHAENWELDFLGFLPGKRESRRMVGEYTITQQDISQNRIFEDTVAYGGWPMDDHFPAGFYHDGQNNINIETPAPYCIPYRALYAKQVANLFFAGRNISMTHMAMSSIRVMATCALMGQAVGAAAALAARHSLSPHGVYLHRLSELQQTLLDSDCFLPHIDRKVSSLCRNTPILNGDDSLKNGKDRPNAIYPDSPCGVAVKNGTTLEYRFEKPEFVHALHITFDSDLNRETLPGDYCERIHTMRCNTRLDSPQFYVPKTLCKAFQITVTTAAASETIWEENCNRKRAYHLDINREITGICLTPVANWGEQDYTTIFSFDFS